ncbi:MAG: histidinol-phosphatase HisJ family protein [Caulobacteraceae bacterium]
MNYLMDYHVHSTHSIDGHSTIMELCRSAISKGINEIVITDHFEPYDGNGGCPQYDQKHYWIEAIKARKVFKGRLQVKMGVELGQPHLFPESSEAVLADFPYDYVIGSVHKFPGGKDASELDYSAISEEDACSMYLTQLKQLIAWNNFDCIGHLDLIKRYSVGTYGRNISLVCQYDLLREVLKAAIVKGKGIEINTSGLRQTPRETMPGLDVLRLYKELGGEVLTIGSDAHFASDVGKGVPEALDMAREAGFKFITVFKDREPQWIRISGEKNAYGNTLQTNTI